MKFLTTTMTLALAALLATPASAVTLRFDFGNDDGVAGVNAVTWNAQDVPNAVANDLSGPTGISLTVDLINSTGWNHIGPNGSGENPAAAPASGFFPEGDLTRDALFGHSDNFNAGAPRDLVIYDIAGLAANTDYDYTFYASRGSVGDNRETSYDVDGNVALLDAGNNVGGIAQLLSITSSPTGTATLTIEAGPNNTNGSEFFYLGAMQINTTVPEPGSILLASFGSLAMLGIRRSRR